MWSKREIILASTVKKVLFVAQTFCYSSTMMTSSSGRSNETFVCQRVLFQHTEQTLNPPCFNIQKCTLHGIIITFFPTMNASSMSLFGYLMTLHGRVICCLQHTRVRTGSFTCPSSKHLLTATSPNTHWLFYFPEQ